MYNIADFSTKSELSSDEKVGLYKLVQLIRRVEDTLAERYHEQEMRTPSHFGTGQEAPAAAVCFGLLKEDAVFSHHRAHNHYLACGGDVTKLAAELYGRVTGSAKGRGGSVHLTDRETPFVVSTAILGQTIPLAVGSALAFKMDKKPNVAIAFFGDASCEEGILYESMNYAAINQLPVLFICENNLYSTESPLEVRQPPGTELVERAHAFRVPAHKLDGNDVYSLQAVVSRILEGMRAGGGPAFLECMTYRWREHVGPKFDHDLGRTYRSREELVEWQARCPVVKAGQYLLKEGVVSEADLGKIAEEVQEGVDCAIEIARTAPWPSVQALYDYVY